MSTNFKPLSEQIADKLIKELNEATSVFHRKDPLQMPFNASTGKAYRGAPALILLMKNEKDPRWMTLEQGNFHKNNVMKDEKGTLISFYKTHEMQPSTELKENGKPKMVSVKLEEPVLATAFLFNGRQLKDMPALEPKVAEPMEAVRPKIEAIIAEKPHESSVRDAFKANMAELFLAAMHQQPFDLGDNIGYTASWAQLLKEQPSELFKIANDAQKIADQVMRPEKKSEVTLNKGDEITYKGDTIKVLA
ncbi:MAG TPA: ArdC-like ssDNA-binding domain-containing protein, partial [Mucilaginibacter sp.]